MPNAYQGSFDERYVFESKQSGRNIHCCLQSLWKTASKIKFERFGNGQFEGHPFRGIFGAISEQVPL